MTDAARAPARRVGLFGGTFDPPHNAHLALARTALNALALDEVRWLPSGQPWQKTGSGRSVTPAADRAAMVALAIAGETGFSLGLDEVRRAGPSFTIDTVRALALAEPQVHWLLLLGQDQFAALHTWYDWPALLALVELAVAQRPGAALHADPAVLRQARVLPLPMTPQALSSTALRAAVSRAEDIAAQLPAKVASYIAAHGLYRTPVVTPPA